MRNNTFVRLTKLALAFFVTTLFAGCASNNFPYNSMVKDQQYKPGTIAVVAGHDDEATLKLAEFLTKDLAERSTFTVMSQADVARHFRSYPVDIRIHQDKDIKEDDPTPVWFLPSEKAKIDAIQARLKVNYVFMVWNRAVIRVSGSDNQDEVYPGGNLIEYPGGTVVGATYSGAHSTRSPLAMFRADDYYILDALDYAAGRIADEFVNATKSAK